jgi:uncharacterized membrane protein
MNMGLYNGLLGAGFVWALRAEPEFGMRLALYCAAFMLIAGLFAGPTVSWGIPVLQGLPAALALFALQTRR